jgi:hypothetical protein
VSTIDQAFIRAYEPKRDVGGETSPADQGVAANAAPLESFDGAIYDDHTSSFYVFADGALHLPPSDVSTKSQSIDQPIRNSNSHRVSSTGVQPPNAPVAQFDAVKQRRPLSDFIETSAVEGTFRPAFEVDHFVGPRVATRVLLVPAADRAARARAPAPPPPPPRGYAKLYHEHVLPADQGCDFDFLTSDRAAF